MSAAVPVLTAVTGASWEARLVAALERQQVGVTVVRRCVDLADLLAAAAAGTARAALLSADLRRLDRDALARLAAAGVAVIGLYPPGDDTAERWLRQLGVRHLLPADASADAVGAAVTTAVLDDPLADERLLDDPLLDPPRPSPAGWADPAAALPHEPPPSRRGALPEPSPGSGQLLAVWGPTGAPGRTTVAVTLASELARLGVPTLLADADVYGGVVAQVLGLLDEFPGLAAAARLANTGALDLPALARLAPDVGGLRVLTGIPRAERWPELRPAALETVWSLARTLAQVTVVDCAFALEADEEISFDTAAPRRNGATAATLDAADLVIAVGAGDPVGIQRLVRGLAQLREGYPDTPVRVVVTKVRRGVVGPDPERQLAAALARYAAVSDPVLVPYDRAGLDAALLAGRALGEVASSSPARLAIAGLAAELTGRARPPQRHRRLRRGA